MSIGEQVINRIISSKLFTVMSDSGCVIVWSANAPEQLDALIKEKRMQEIDSIRITMHDVMNSCESGESTLNGMKAMMAAFELAVSLTG